MINRALTKKLMRAGGWTYEALLAATGLDLANLYRILTGKQAPRVSTNAGGRVVERQRVDRRYFEAADWCYASR